MTGEKGRRHAVDLDEDTIIPEELAERILELENNYLMRRFSDQREKLLILSEAVPKDSIPLSTAIASIRDGRTFDCCMRYFGDVEVRDKFLHSPLSRGDRVRCSMVLKSLFDEGVSDESIFVVYTRLPRYTLFHYRKKGDGYLEYAKNHVMQIIEWYKSDFFPISDTEPSLRHALDIGVAYWMGRDLKHRPILVLRPTSNMMCATTFERAIIFLFEWARLYLFVPGVSETAVIWFDVSALPLSKVPYSDIQSIIGKLTMRYPFHLDNMFLIHDSMLIQTITPIVRTFMTDLQKLKIRIVRRRISSNDMKSFEPSLIEKQYGGHRDAISTYYPFPILSAEYSDPGLLEVWDSKCIEGFPYLFKQVELPINTIAIPSLIERMDSQENNSEQMAMFISELERHLQLIGDDREFYISNYREIPLLSGAIKPVVKELPSEAVDINDTALLAITDLEKRQTVGEETDIHNQVSTIDSEADGMIHSSTSAMNEVDVNGIDSQPSAEKGDGDIHTEPEAHELSRGQMFLCPAPFMFCKESLGRSAGYTNVPDDEFRPK
eukprot:GHVH01001447.1.p1 GENE.GHVH01001447.1~~GHVH01001447.1.p1  ORF type:complete len:550 (+),score=68.78 GHVH01001447.1:147-1796(+)